MSEHVQTNYTQGYSSSTLRSHASRTASSDAAFLLPHLRASDYILDVGCGPGTITASLASHVPAGFVTGIDLSEDVLATARTLHAGILAPAPPPGGEPDSSSSSGDGGHVTFLCADVLAGLPFPDASFDVVYASQLFPHLPPPELPLRAMREMRRVLKPGGLLASRDVVDVQYFPSELGLSPLLRRNMLRGFGGHSTAFAGEGMPRLCRQAGFDVDGGKVVVGSGTTTVAGKEAVAVYAQGMLGRLSVGDPYRASWEKAGITMEEIQEVRNLTERWAETDDAWYVAVQCEILAWK